MVAQMSLDGMRAVAPNVHQSTNPPLLRTPLHRACDVARPVQGLVTEESESSGFSADGPGNDVKCNAVARSRTTLSPSEQQPQTTRRGTRVPSPTVVQRAQRAQRAQRRGSRPPSQQVGGGGGVVPAQKKPSDIRHVPDKAWRRAATGSKGVSVSEQPRSTVKGSREDDSNVTSSLKCGSASFGSHPELMEFFESVRDFELSISQLTGI